MNLLQQVLRSFTPVTNEIEKQTALQASTETKGLDPMQPGEYARTFPVNSIGIGTYGAGKFVKAYTSSSDLYSVASFLIRKLASIPWYVYEQKPGEKAAIALNRYKQLTSGALTPAALGQALIARKAAYDENRVLSSDSGLGKLLARPNANQGQDQLFEALFGYRILSGEANLWANRGGGTAGPIVELQVLPTQFVEDAYDPRDLYGILGHRLAVGTNIPIAKENLMRWKNWRPDFDAATRIHMRGLSIVEVGWKTYLMGDYGAEATAKLLKNGGAKGALTPVPVGNQVLRLEKPQLDAATNAVNERINGIENLNQIGVLAGPYDYLNFGLTAVDMDIINLMDLSLQQWCRMLGLPPVLFTPDNMADNNYQNALRDLVSNTCIPLLASLRDQLNKFLLPAFKVQGRAFIDFDVSGLAELQRDIEKLVNSLTRAYWLTEDEKRVMMNYEPKQGIYATSLVPQGLTPIEMIGMDLSTQEPPAQPGEDTEDDTDEEPDIAY
jgi:HK97 family phage portal protein